MIEMGRVFQAGVATTDTDRLPAEKFERLRLELDLAGLEFAENSGQLSPEEKLTAFRQTYEPFLHALARYLVLPLPDWLPVGTGIDNWQNNPRGKTAQAVDRIRPS